MLTLEPQRIATARMAVPRAGIVNEMGAGRAELFAAAASPGVATMGAGRPADRRDRTVVGNMNAPHPRKML
ncbi:MAG: hypothetical protein U0230_24080 [Polyangiales bacterium]